MEEAAETGADGLVAQPQTEQAVRSGGSARALGRFGFDAWHFDAKSIGHALRLFGGLLQRLLQRLGGRCQAAWLSFCSLFHVAVSTMVNWLLSDVATVRAWGDCRSERRL